MSNRIGARILADTLRPSFIAGSNFHFRTASRAGLSNAGSELFSTFALATRPFASTTKITVTTPSIFRERRAAGYTGAGCYTARGF